MPVHARLRGEGRGAERGREREGEFVRCPNLVSLAVINTINEWNFEKKRVYISSYW